MTADGVIRPATLADIDALVVLENRVFPGDRLSRRSLRYYAGAPTASLLVLTEGGAIAGDAVLAFRRGTQVARLYSIAIAPEMAGQGWGRRLLAACEAEARRRGCTTLRLEVRSDNAAAIRLYETGGYRRFGSYDDYYDDGASAWRYEIVLDGPGTGGKPSA